MGIKAILKKQRKRKRRRERAIMDLDSFVVSAQASGMSREQTIREARRKFGNSNLWAILLPLLLELLKALFDKDE